MKKQVILENPDLDIEEMARKENAKYRPLIDDDGTKLGFEMRANPQDVTSPMVAVLFVGCDEITKFEEENQQLIEKIHEKFGNVLLSSDKCPGNARPNINSKRKYWKSSRHDNKDGVESIPPESYGGPNKNKTASEKNKREGFHPILRSFFQSERNSGPTEIQTLLEKRLFPRIVTDDKKRNTGTGVKGNEKLRFISRDIITFEDHKEFMRAGKLTAAGKFDYSSVEKKHLARQDKTVTLGKWSPNEKTGTKVDKGLTDKYKLRKSGFAEQDNNIVLQSVFEIVGEKVGDNNFQWTLKFYVELGKKRPDQESIVDGMKPIDETKITDSVNVNLDPNKEFNDDDLIVNDISVMGGMEEILTNFQEKLTQIKPITILKYGVIKKTDVERIQESAYGRIMSKLLRETITKNK